VEEFLHRLRQRKLVQWALAYLAAAWALLQVLALVVDTYGWPHLVMKLAFAAVALGFVVALVLAWYHGERGAQKVSGPELLILALLLAVGGVLIGLQVPKPVVAARLATATLEVPQSASSIAANKTAPARAASLADSAKPVTPEVSIAVLPMTYLSGRAEDQGFADGLSDDLILALSHYQGLKVIARNSSFQFRGRNEDSVAIGRKLGVGHLLEGSVQRSGDLVRVNVALVDASNGVTQWSARYQRKFTDLFAMQDEVTHAVVQELRPVLVDVPGAVLQTDRPPGGNPDAWTAYLEGQNYLTTGDSDAYAPAIESLRTAIRLDPHYALAYATLAGVMGNHAEGSLTGDAAHRALKEAQGNADKALELDPNLAMAHRIKAYLASIDTFDWETTAAELRRALQLAPHDGSTLSIYGYLQGMLGHLQCGVRLARAGLALDPRNVRYHSQLFSVAMGAGQLQVAEQALRDIAVLAPEEPLGFARALLAIQRHDAAAALAAARSAHTRGDGPNLIEALALQIGKDRTAADAALQALLQQGDSVALNIAWVYALRGERAPMFHWLERVRDLHPAQIRGLRVDPIFKPYIDDPRFLALLASIGLPKTVTTKGFECMPGGDVSI
jgi:TolB-like protein/Tfp pilus assembly protein PilF